MTSAAADLAVIVFAYNERENLAPVLMELLAYLDRHGPAAEVIVVDDGSSDGSAEVAEQVLAGRRAQVVRHGQNRGIGAALKSGVAACSAPWVTFLPADGQIEPQAIGTLRGALDTPRVGAVLSVYADRDDGWRRTFLSWGIRSLITLLLGVRVDSDGPYLFRRELFEEQRLKPDTFFLNFEFPIRLARLRVPLRTVTIRCRPRRAGHSKSANLGRIVAVAQDLLALRLRLWTERPVAALSDQPGAR